MPLPTGFVTGFACAVLATASVLAAVTDALPQSAENQAAAKVQTGILAGRVLDAETNRPIRRVIVQVRSEALPGRPQVSRRVSTDGNGRWEIRDLPARSYMVTALRDGYVIRQYGQVQAFGPGRPIDLKAGQAIDKVDVALNRGGVITGVIVDDHGEPIGNIRVRAKRPRYVNGVRRLVESPYSALTDDLGRYRLHGLPPGSYILSAVSESSLIGDPQDTAGFAETYYPGTVLPRDAEAIPARYLPEPPPANFGLVPTRVARIAGRILTSSGSFPNAIFSPNATFSVSLEAADDRTSWGYSSNNDVFEFTGVQPGDYLLRVRAVQLAPNFQGGIAELATLPLTVVGDDMTDLVVRTGSASVLTGRIVTDSALERTPAGLSVQAIDMASGRSSTTRTSIETVGRFVIPGLWGQHVFRLQGSADWWLKAVILDGRDIIDSGVDLGSVTPAGEMEIVVTRQATALSGSVVDDQGRPRLEYVVVAFSPDAARRTPGTRFIRSTTPNRDGTFLLRGLPPGDYVLVAVAELEVGDETNPELLDKWRAAGTPTTLAEFESKTVRLTLTR